MKVLNVLRTIIIVFCVVPISITLHAQSVASANNVSILLSYCHAGQTVTAQVFNALANPVGDPVTIVSDGHSWDRLQIPAPSQAGTYYIHVSAEYLSQTLPYSVN
jgi:hypothetical protein